jgi:hypothetical protein
MDDLPVIAKAAPELQRKHRQKSQFCGARRPAASAPFPRLNKLHSSSLRVEHFAGTHCCWAEKSYDALKFHKINK